MKETQLKILILLFTTTFLSSCIEEKRKPSKPDLELAVFYEVFPLIIDSIYYDSRLNSPPPPPPEVLAIKGYDVKKGFKKAYEDWGKSEEYFNRERDWQRKKDSIIHDTTSVYLTIFDSISRFEREDLYELIKHFKKEHIVIDSEEIDFYKSFKIDLNKLKTTKEKLRFKNQLDFPRGSKFRKTEYEITMEASVSFNRILFDKSKRFGVLNCSYVRGRLNGTGFRIFIRKDKNGNWIVDQIINTWIS